MKRRRIPPKTGRNPQKNPVSLLTFLKTVWRTTTLTPKLNKNWNINTLTQTLTEEDKIQIHLDESVSTG